MRSGVSQNVFISWNRYRYHIQEGKKKRCVINLSLRNVAVERERIILISLAHETSSIKETVIILQGLTAFPSP